MAKGQAERLMPMLEEMLSEAGLAWGDLGLIGVGVGPGNFTGTRIAVAAARGLALGLGVPAVGVSGFDVVHALHPTATALVDAPGGKVFACAPGGTPRLDDSAKGVRLSSIDPLRRISTLAELAATRADAPPPVPVYLRPADAALPSAPLPALLD